MERIRLDVEGMSCGHCVAAVRDALQSVQGVKVEQVEVGAATVSYDPEVTSTERIASAVEDAGYSASRAS